MTWLQELDVRNNSLNYIDNGVLVRKNLSLLWDENLFKPLSTPLHTYISFIGVPSLLDLCLNFIANNWDHQDLIHSQRLNENNQMEAEPQSNQPNQLKEKLPRHLITDDLKKKLVEDGRLCDGCCTLFYGEGGLHITSCASTPWRNGGVYVPTKLAFCHINCFKKNHHVSPEGWQLFQQLQ